MVVAVQKDGVDHGKRSGVGAKDAAKPPPPAAAQPFL